MRGTIILSIVAISGCASSSGARGTPTSDETVRIVGARETIELRTSATVTASLDTLFAPLDQVWRALPAAYEALAIRVTDLDSANHVIANSGLIVRRQLGKVALTRYLDCGDSQGVPSAETYEIRLSVLTRLQASAAGTSIVATSVQATGRPVSVSGMDVRCSSTRQLESRLVNALRAQLQR